MFDADSDIGRQRTPAGDYAVTEYVGSWDMRPAYDLILDRLRKDSTRVGICHGVNNL